MEETNTPDIEAEKQANYLLTQLLGSVLAVFAVIYVGEQFGLWGLVPLIALLSTKLWWDYRLWKIEEQKV